MRSPFLAIKPEISEIKDMIVLSCMLAEHKLRIISAMQAKNAMCMMTYL